jgi:hypothetical protein
MKALITTNLYLIPQDVPTFIRATKSDKDEHVKRFMLDWVFDKVVREVNAGN